MIILTYHYYFDWHCFHHDPMQNYIKHNIIVSSSPFPLLQNILEHMEKFGMGHLDLCVEARATSLSNLALWLHGLPEIAVEVRPMG